MLEQGLAGPRGTEVCVTALPIPAPALLAFAYAPSTVSVQAAVEADTSAPLRLAEYRSEAETGCMYECAGWPACCCASPLLLILTGWCAGADLDHTADIQLHACKYLPA